MPKGIRKLKKANLFDHNYWTAEIKSHRNSFDFGKSPLTPQAPDSQHLKEHGSVK